MAGYPPPYPPPPGSPYGGRFGQDRGDWKYQRRMLRDQARAQREMFRAQRDAYRAQSRGMRRGSIAGPILVIGIGVLFLLVQTGKLPSGVLWHFYGQWWPVLLIGIGAIVLIEWAFDQFFRDQTKPYVRRGIGGGIVTLVVFVILGGLAAEGLRDGSTPFGHSLNFNQDDIEQFMGDKHESDQTLAQAFPGEGRLEVDNPRGDVTISGTSDDNQIHVIVHKEIYSRSDDDAASKAQQLTPALETNGGTVQLRLPAIEGARADLIVTVPAIATSTVMANHGDVHLSGLKGAVNVTANHGDVELSAITGTVSARLLNSGSDFSAHSIKGQVTLDGKAKDVTIAEIDGNVAMQGDFYGDSHLEHIRGTFRFKSSRTDFQLVRLDGNVDFSDDDLTAEQVVGPVFLSTRYRNITLDRVAGDITVTNKKGKVDITAAPPLGNISVENREGEVNLTLPDEAPFTVHAETVSADIQNDFAFPVAEMNDHKSITGTVGKGTASIRITTTQDNIALKRANVAPLAPLPPAPPALTAVPAPPGEAGKALRNSARTATEETRKATADAKRAADEAAKDASHE